MTLRIERGAMILGVPAATLYHYPLVVQYAAYGDGTTPGCKLRLITRYRDRPGAVLHF